MARTLSKTNPGPKPITFGEFSRALLKFLIFKVPRILIHWRGFQEPYKTGRSNIGKYLEKNSVKFADHPALFFEEKKWTWKEYNQAINQYANYFLSLGIKKGDVFVVFMENRPEMLFLVAAAAKIGAVASLINASLRQEGLVHCMTVAPSKFYVVAEELVEAFEEVRDQLPNAEEETVYYISEKPNLYDLAGFQDLNALVRTASRDNPSTVADVTANDAFAYVFTSGTTGLPKPAFQYHKSWCRIGVAIGKGLAGLSHKDVFYIPLPLFHTNPVKMAWGCVHVSGAALVLTRKFSTSGFWDIVKKYNVTAFNYVGELCTYLYNAPEKPDDSNNTVRMIMGNGLRTHIFKDFKKRFKIKEVYEGYGASEGDTGCMNILNLEETIGPMTTKGAIVKYDMENDECIRDENGWLQKVGKGEAGLMLAEASPLIFFYINPANTEKKIIRNGFKQGDAWFNTGDMIRDIGFGHCQFADRLGDTFRWKGENVATMEVEKILHQFDEIDQCTVYGVEVPGSDGKLGMAAVIPFGEVESFDTKGLAQMLVESLPAYAVPRFLRFIKEFDTTPTAKIKKTRLQDQGFNLDEVDDPLYILPLGSTTYEPLSEERYQSVLNGSVRF